MARLFKISLIFFLVASFNTCSGLDKEQKAALKKALKLFDKAAERLAALSTFSDFIKGAYALITDDPDPNDVTHAHLVQLDKKMDKSFERIKSLEKRVINHIDNFAISNELQSSFRVLHKRASHIDYHYTAYKDFLNPRMSFRPETVERFARSITDYDESGINTILEKTYDAFVISVGKTRNIPMLLTDPEIVRDFTCIMRESPQQILVNLLIRVVLNEINGVTMIKFADKILNAVDNETETTSIVSQAEKLSRNRLDTIFKVTKNVIGAASREIWKCDADYPGEGANYARIGPVFQKYFMNVLNTDKYDNKAECNVKCEWHTEVRHSCRHGSCPAPCKGKIRNCTTVEKPLSYCLASESDKYRRYQYLTVDGKNYGLNTTCEGDVHETKPADSDHTGLCKNCMCTCEDGSNEKMDKYVSLKKVESMYQYDYVISAARIVLLDNIFRIQVQEAMLLPNGRVREPTYLWIDSVDFNITGHENNVNYTEIKWDTKTVCLDDLDMKSSGPKEEPRVLTGIRFARDPVPDNGSKYVIHLEIQLSRFNFATGEILDKEGPQEILSNRDFTAKRFKYKSLPMDQLDIPTRHKNYRQRSTSNQCFDFTTSSLEQDAGQTVLPFIDTQTVENVPAVPLSGAGLFIRADNQGDSGGYLSLKLFTLDAAQFIGEIKKMN